MQREFASSVSPRQGGCPLCANSCPSYEVTGSDPTEPILSPPTDLPDRYSGGAPGDEKKVRRNIVELDADRDSLRQAYPAESRIDESQQVAAGAAVLVLDAEGDA